MRAVELQEANYVEICIDPFFQVDFLKIVHKCRLKEGDERNWFEKERSLRLRPWEVNNKEIYIHPLFPGHTFTVVINRHSESVNLQRLHSIPFTVVKI